MGSATALSFCLGSLLGIVAGSRPGSFRDRFLSIGSLALYAVPGFWLGLVLTVIFSVQLRWLPSSGIETIASGKSRTGPRPRHRATSRAAGRGTWPHLSGALSPRHAGRHGRGLAAWISCWPRERAAFRAAASCSARGAQCPAAAGHHARPAIGGHARRQRRDRERVLRPRTRPAGAGGGGVARHAAAARHHPGQRRHGDRSSISIVDIALCLARSARRRGRGRA